MASLLRNPRRRSRRLAVPLALALGLLACQHPAVIGGGNPGTGGGGGAGSTGGPGAGGAGARDGGGAGGGSTGSGGGGTSGVDAGPTRGPTPPTATTRFPFPQNREATANCIYPAGYRNEDAQAAYAQWKADTVTADGAVGHLRVKRLASDPALEIGSTVSEGIAYGMLIAVYMGDQTLFDELWKYEQQFLDMDTGLMDWYISADGVRHLGTGAATDADEDMAFALLMADKQWGGKGTLDKNYLDHARDQIRKIWEHEIFESKLLRPGDWGDWNSINISYFAPAYYRLFARVDDPAHDWNAVIKTVYDTIAIALHTENGNLTNGLVPAWCSSQGLKCTPNPTVSPSGKTNYQYDSCRTPFRIGLDWCWFGESRARDYVAKTSAFFSGIGAANIADGYALNGNPEPEHAGQRSAAFTGPAAVGAMSAATYQTFVNQAYAALATRTLLAGGTYYEESWTVMSLLMLTGNFLDLTRY